VLALLLLCVAPAAVASEPSRSAVRETLRSEECGSVVFRACPGQQQGSVRAGSAARPEGLSVHDDGSEILITEDRLRDESVAKIFDRSLGVHGGVVTRDLGNGMRCTGRVSQMTCTRPANAVQGQAGPSPDWSDWTF
jgi:hypothetical protein